MESNHIESVVFILTEKTTQGDFEELARSEQWELAEIHEGDGSLTGYSQAWFASDGETQIHFVREPTIDIRFLVTHGPAIEQVADAIMLNLVVRTSVNVLRLARTAVSDEEKGISALELAVVFRDFDPRALEILRNYYKDGSEVLRRDVLAALIYRGWLQGVEFLEEISRIDESKEVRDLAAEMALMWKRRLPGDQDQANED